MATTPLLVARPCIGVATTEKRHGLLLDTDAIERALRAVSFHGPNQATIVQHPPFVVAARRA